MQLSEYSYQFSCERKSGLISCTKGGAMYGECLALHQLLAGKLCYTFIYIHAWNHYWTVSAVQVLGSQWRTLERILFLGLGLAVTEINTKKVQKQEKKKCIKM